MPNSLAIHASVRQQTGTIVLDRPAALNGLSLAMVRDLAAILRAWADDAAVAAVVIRSSSEKAFCAGGDIRFFHDVGRATPQGGSALLEDFFTEEYALNHLIHHYPKPLIALMDGVVMGGGMGICQAAPAQRVRIVTEGTRMAMPEVNIGLFPDVGASYFLPRTPGHLGRYLGLTGLTIVAADALYTGLADLFVPQAQMGALLALLDATPGTGLRNAVEKFAAPFHAAVGISILCQQRSVIEHHFSAPSVKGIMESLAADSAEFACQAYAAMNLRSPLMMAVTFELLQRGASLGLADCLRMSVAWCATLFSMATCWKACARWWSTRIGHRAGRHRPWPTSRRTWWADFSYRFGQSRRIPYAT